MDKYPELQYLKSFYEIRQKSEFPWPEEVNIMDYFIVEQIDETKGLIKLDE